MPSFTICTFLTLANSFKLFDQNLALTAGARQQSAMLRWISIILFMAAWLWRRRSGESVMFFLFVASIVMLQLLVSRSREVEVWWIPNNLSGNLTLFPGHSCRPVPGAYLIVLWFLQRQVLYFRRAICPAQCPDLCWIKELHLRPWENRLRPGLWIFAFYYRFSVGTIVLFTSMTAWCITRVKSKLSTFFTTYWFFDDRAFPNGDVYHSKMANVMRLDNRLVLLWFTWDLVRIIRIYL